MSDLARFVEAQDACYDEVCAELRAGRKRGHWIWFVFPQLVGLGLSTTSRFYAIHDLEQARAYLAHPVLGARLRECAGLVAATTGRSAVDIFGRVDAQKLHSSMTLFHLADPDEAIFADVLHQYFDGVEDGGTLRLLHLSADDRPTPPRPDDRR